MKQVRIAQKNGVVPAEGQHFVCEWMEASLMNRWFLKTRLAEAVQSHGEGSHWIEFREKSQLRELTEA